MVKIKFIAAFAISLLFTATLWANPTRAWAAPTVISIVPLTVGPSLASSENFAVTFSEGVTGVDASDFRPVATGTVTGSVSSISGMTTDRVTYWVNVVGITGEGTLRLDVKSSGTGIVDSDNIGLAGGFTSGEVRTVSQPVQPVPTLSEWSMIVLGTLLAGGAALYIRRRHATA